MNGGRLSVKEFMCLSNEYEDAKEFQGKGFSVF